MTLSQFKAYIAKGLLPYRGLGSGIKRALENWPYIDFVDDRDGSLLTLSPPQKPIQWQREWERLGYIAIGSE